MPDQLWKGSPRNGNPAGIVLLSTTNLNALVTGNVSGIGPEIEQDSGTANLDLFMDAIIDVTFAALPTNNSVCDLYVVRRVIDGSYEDGVGGAPGTYVLPANGYVGSFRIRNVTTQQRIAIGFIEVPPRQHRFLLLNVSGTTFPATATVRGYYYRYQSL